MPCKKGWILFSSLFSSSPLLLFSPFSFFFSPKSLHKNPPCLADDPLAWFDRHSAAINGQPVPFEPIFVVTSSSLFITYTVPEDVSGLFRRSPYAHVVWLVHSRGSVILFPPRNFHVIVRYRYSCDQSPTPMICSVHLTDG